MLLRHRSPRAGNALGIAAIFLLFFLSTGIGARLLVHPLERFAQVLPSAHETGAEAIVVLAAGRYAAAPEFGGNEIPDYIALARLRYAARLHRQSGLPILVSGGNGSADGRFRPKAIAMADALKEDFAIPVKWIEPDSANTAENASFSAAMLKQEGITRVLLVTDAMHMARSAMAFSRSGMDVIPAPTIFFSAGRPSWMDLLPSAEHLRRSYYATYEWIGLAWYAVRHTTNPEAPRRMDEVGAGARQAGRSLP
ncbi:YdcF family protein [Noviherbaspirillum sp.]|uniref:YdcF family protein n=1 Tax=Noviherbaspirillum sp. TaxID=1926288 RepID=UPI002FDFC28D